MDDILNESGDEEESDQIVNQVLDEIGIEIAGKVAEAPSAGRGKIGETALPSVPTTDDLEEQLAKLRSS
jgi:charged multivesicular body protein 2B